MAQTTFSDAPPAADTKTTLPELSVDGNRIVDKNGNYEPTAQGRFFRSVLMNED